MSIKKIISILAMVCISISGMAQKGNNSSATQNAYNQAVTEYNRGQFGKCVADLKHVISAGEGMLKTSAYRLLALCKLEQGNFSEAKNVISDMLRYDPYFAPSLGDSQRFIDIINEIKRQEAGITTASRQAETLDEAPVPVTLITEEMIRYSGAQTLQQLLCLYVPGMTQAEGMESSVAMHGVYALSQDKILFMLDGHRLNSYSTNAEAPDFRNSLDKIQQIEVLRGPASSLYGNVALTAVVNIITRKGAAMNGGRLSATVGTQSTYGGSLVVGGGNNVLDLLAWGSMNYTKGFAHTVDDGKGGTSTLYSNGFRGRPSYDIGMKGRWKDFSFTLNLQRSKRVPYINVLQIPNDINSEDLIAYEHQVSPNQNTYKNFDYDRYDAIGGDRPGVTRSNNRLNLDYKHSFGNIDFEASSYLSMERTSFYNVLGNNVDSIIGSLMISLLAMKGYQSEPGSISYRVNEMLGKMPVYQNGVYQKLDWQNNTFGIQTQARTNYNFLGRGSLVVGFQYEFFSLTNGTFSAGGNYNGAGVLSSDLPFEHGNEKTASGFLQFKHYFSPNVIFSAGLRYDHKKRFNDETLDRLSPRASLIAKLGKGFSLRGAYNYSFVDAPYLYRATVITLFSGGKDMRPETMHSFNVDMSYHKAASPLMAEVGMFYNILNDLTVLNPKIKPESEQSTAIAPYLFINAGKVRILGAEGSIQYNTKKLFLNANATWQRIVTSDSYMVYNSQTYSTPALHGNITAAWTPINHLWLKASANIQSASYYQTFDLLTTYFSNDFISEFHRVPPQCTLNCGVGIGTKYLNIDLTLSNITNNKYKIGSMLIDGVPHAGRQFLAKVTYKF